jgi:hypothetical protein
LEGGEGDDVDDSADLGTAAAELAGCHAEMIADPGPPLVRMHRPWRRVEEPGLHRARRSRLRPGQLQQSAQPGVLARSSASSLATCAGIARSASRSCTLISLWRAAANKSHTDIPGATPIRQPRS